MIRKAIFLIVLLFLLMVPVSAGVYRVNLSMDEVGETTNGSFSSLRNGEGDYLKVGGTYGEIIVYAGAGLAADQWDYLYRIILVGNTSVIPDTDTITAANLTLFYRYRTNGFDEHPNLTFIYSNPQNYSAIAATDYSRTNFTRIITSDLYYHDLNTTAKGINVLTLNTFGQGIINKTGSTAIMGDFQHSVDNVSPTWADDSDNDMSFYMPSYDSGNETPYLTITTTEASTSFTKNATIGTPLCTVQFTDTSTGSPGTWSWSFTDVTNTTLVETVFATTQNTTHAFGSGNFSIQLDAAGNKTPANISWVNVSAGGTDTIDYNVSLTVANYPRYPADHIFSVPIDTMPVNSSSDAYIATMNELCVGHAWGCSLYQSRGIPVMGVGDGLAKQNLTTITHPERGYGADVNVLFPIPDVSTYEYDPEESSIYIAGTGVNTAYEGYDPIRAANGSWSAYSMLKFDCDNYTLGYYGGAVSNSGLPIMPALITYEEVINGSINHTMPGYIHTTGNHWVWPARQAGTNANHSYAPSGMRFRLKSTFDVSSYDTYEKVILNGLKKYGFQIYDSTNDDNNLVIKSVEYSDTRWEDIGLDGTNFVDVHASDFEAVDVSSLMIDPESGQANMDALAPTAIFTKNQTTGIQPLSIQFNDTSIGAPTMWNWSFGDGNWSNGTTQNVTHTYDFVGTFNPFLIATNAAGSNQSANQPITVITTPVASFVKSRQFVIIPQSVRFNDTSTNSPTNWSWDFGDG